MSGRCDYFDFVSYEENLGCTSGSCTPYYHVSGCNLCALYTLYVENRMLSYETAPMLYAEGE